MSRAEGIEASSADVEGRISRWDLGLDIDFPPGSTILIPSARNALFICRRTRLLWREQELRQREPDRERRWRDSQELFSKMSEFEAR